MDSDIEKPVLTKLLASTESAALSVLIELGGLLRSGKLTSKQRARVLKRYLVTADYLTMVRIEPY